MIVLDRQTNIPRRRRRLYLSGIVCNKGAHSNRHIDNGGFGVMLVYTPDNPFRSIDSSRKSSATETDEEENRIFTWKKTGLSSHFVTKRGLRSTCDKLPDSSHQRPLESIYQQIPQLKRCYVEDRGARITRSGFISWQASSLRSLSLGPSAEVDLTSTLECKSGRIQPNRTAVCRATNWYKLYVTYSAGAMRS